MKNKKNKTEKIPKVTGIRIYREGRGHILQLDFIDGFLQFPVEGKVGKFLWNMMERESNRKAPKGVRKVK